MMRATQMSHHWYIMTRLDRVERHAIENESAFSLQRFLFDRDERDCKLKQSARSRGHDGRGSRASRHGDTARTIAAEWKRHQRMRRPRIGAG